MLDDGVDDDVPAIARLFPDAKVIACVRQLAWVIDSIERLIRRNVFTPSSIFNYKPGGTVYTRANGVAAQDGMVGAPYDALKQACFGAQRENLLQSDAWRPEAMSRRE